ncbi:hypothetical protein [Nonomuraea ceibae]|uniref:hypothetical protein n=1 Tax=Nonomuraea ceibae TaxID=1935170 RepID=UPI001C5DE03B|nr:hypothetical protein [Nonomuraea ceibae]
MSGLVDVSPVPLRPATEADWATATAHATETYARLVPLLAQQLRIRISPDGGKSFPGGKHTRPLAPVRPQLPDKPSTIDLFTPEATSQVLWLDFDVARTPGHPDSSATDLVAKHAQGVLDLITRCGGRAIHTLSPSGGRHLIIRWSAPLPHDELLRLARALKHRFPSLDLNPLSRGGQIRPPGARHKIHRGRLTGFVLLTMPIEQAEHILHRPCGANVWTALQQELTTELALLDAPATRTGAMPSLTAGEAGRTCPDCDIVIDIPLDIDGHPWLQRTGGARPPQPPYQQLALAGDWKATGAASASEPRLGLLNHLAAGGHRLSDIRTRIRSGEWAGLARLLDSRAQGTRTPDQQDELLRRDWHKAVSGVAWTRHVRKHHTSQSYLSTAPPLAADSVSPSDRLLAGAQDRLQTERLYDVDSPSVHDRNIWGIKTVSPAAADTRVLNAWQQILQWRTCIWLAEHDREQLESWGRAAPLVRLLLRAMAVAARMDGSATPAFGCRALALLVGADHSVVARHLKRLREAHDPLIVLVEAGRGKAADRYRLRVPTRYQEEARWIRWRGGFIDILHPALHELGAIAALVLGVLTTAPTGATQVARLARVSRSAGAEALRTLAAYNLAVREPGGWVRGSADLDQVAIELGAKAEWDERRKRYEKERADWHAIVDMWNDPAYERERPVAVAKTDGPEPPWPVAPSLEGAPEEAFEANEPTGASTPDDMAVPGPHRSRRDTGVPRRGRPLAIPGRESPPTEALALVESAGGAPPTRLTRSSFSGLREGAKIPR